MAVTLAASVSLLVVPLLVGVAAFAAGLAIGRERGRLDMMIDHDRGSSATAEIRRWLDATERWLRAAREEIRRFLRGHWIRY